LIKNFRFRYDLPVVKPKDLKFPFSWEKRRPHLEDRVLFVPDYYTLHSAWKFPSWEEIFGNNHPVVIEYCSGNGTWIAEKARHSTRNWVAVEWRFERARKIWSKMKNYSLSNLLVVCGEALTFTREYVPEMSISEAFVNFPDPWPKEKHAKNRLFQPPFATQLSRTVLPGGSLTVATDDPAYARQIIETMESWDHAQVPEWPDYGESYFDDLWRSKGRSIQYHRFNR